MRTILALMLLANTAHAIPNTQALADADTYIATGRRGPAKVKIPGLASGSTVQITQTRLDWNYGAAIHKASHLDKGSYQTKFIENFNAASAGGYWIEHEATRDAVTLSGLERVVDFARDNNLYLRGHNLIYELNQPSWVKPLNNTAMREEISERIDYYVAQGFDELDGYNESYNGGQLGGSGTYWNRLGAAGIAGIYSEMAAKTTAQLFVNDYAALQGAYASFAQHIDTLRAAGASVDGIGLEYYADGADANIPANYRNAFDAMQARGLPAIVSEWGLMQSASPESLRTALRMSFGHPNVTGFYMYDWTNLPEWSFAEASALYRVSGSTFTITETGKAWQDQLGIKDWDGNPNNGWRTNATVTSGAGGEFSFAGYYGDYLITAGGKSYPLSTVEGTADYVLGVGPGDFNADGLVDAADYTVWRDSNGTMEQYEQWKTNFHQTVSTSTSALPENPSLQFIIWLGLLMLQRKWNTRPTGKHSQSPPWTSLAA